MSGGDIIIAAAAAVIIAVLAVYLRQYNKEYAMLVSLTGGIAIFLFIIKKGIKVISFAEDLLKISNINTTDFATLIKILGIAYIIQITSDICRDSGETAIASKVEIAGKIAIVLTVIPLFESVLKILITMLK